MTLLLIILCVVVLAMHYYPDYFSDFLHTIKTTYLRPEISIFELLILGIIVLLLWTIISG
ncbi:hypothetical protein [uncultured phage_MedDCM-OCT-S28-C10]|uniref:Uncharacterized protein n=1 Tax=uncultured phage_MedDCM-OCT-S28-C10 TaxID=2741077 RepID=A0A6S4PFY1_9CAUD|nr:hypothetical protein HOQ60_gp20 [uncultured phage_MedDCM-OCT-S28-C10]BAQ94063.1 hypothetical protein [uncultured phage_MedDCM-OCT-S28-C10]BAR25265.1 hypothetical protein [uncultured Mediterranean phage uvMED]BAR25324.1 hypothetical protein [uncultured Mediterranean phage uvMED]